MMNRNCLSYWFAKLQAAGVPVPRTEILRTEIDLVELCDGKLPAGWDEFNRQLQSAGERIGPAPWFLRTGQGSGKHSWKRTCCVTDPDLLVNHIAGLVEWSHCVDMFGLPHDVWCLREFLPTRRIATLPRYGDMPLVREVRAFVVDGDIRCHHDYWPLESIRDGLIRKEDAEHIYAESIVQGAELSDALALAGAVAAAFSGDGAWSVDLLETDRGWFVTDMAEAKRSYHWPECPHAKGFS